MNVMKNILPSVLATIVSLVAAATAEPSPQQDGSPNAGEKGRRAWFAQTGIPSGMENPAMVMTGDKIEMLTLSNRVAAGPIKIPKDGVIRLVKEIPHPEEEGEVIYQTLARAVVPDGVGKALVIMVPTPKPGADGSLFVTKVESLSNFKGGDFMYINLTKTNIGIEIADEKMVLKAGSMKIHRVEGEGDLVSVPYRYTYYHREKDRWMPLSASMTILSSKRREIFVFGTRGDSGTIRCRGITVPGNI